MEGLLHVLATTDTLYIQANAELRESLSVRLEKYLIADDAVLTDVTEEWQLMHYLGDLPDIAVTTGTLSARSNRFGISGHDLWIPANQFSAEAFLPVASQESLIELEIQNLIPRWGFEITTNTIPSEANLEERAISYKKGCYVGQEIIARLKSVGHVSKCLVQLELTEKLETAETGITINSQSVGQITRSCYFQDARKHMALAYISYASAVIGTQCIIGSKQATVTATSRTDI